MLPEWENPTDAMTQNVPNAQAGTDSPANTVSNTTSMPSLQLASVEQAIRDIELAAQELFRVHVSWWDFYNKILGPQGMVRSRLVSEEQYAQFRRSPAYARIQRMLANLCRRRERGRRGQPIKIITVRVPESIHKALAGEASKLGISINQLCVAKLLQILEPDALEPLTSRSSAQARYSVRPAGTVGFKAASITETERTASHPGESSQENAGQSGTGAE
jgi:hypothetical protein